MTAYFYIKAKPKVIKKNRGFLPTLFLIGGVIFLANVTLPILQYQLKSKTDFRPKIFSPINESNTRVLGQALDIDYTKPNNWFPTAPKLPPLPSKITHYNLSIPELKIEDAVVEIGGEDIIKTLVHYTGTALPGQNGNAVIFGHSVLPQFFNPRNYKTIFATLPTLEKGDEILVDFDGIRYRYHVIEIREIDPSDFSVLTQHHDNQYLTLVTCVPPGTYLRRLAVRAKLI